MTEKRNFMAGDWVDGIGAADNINPSDTRDVIGSYDTGGRRIDHHHAGCR